MVPAQATEFDSGTSGFAQSGVESMAPADVRPRRAQVPEQTGVGAAGRFQHFGQDSEAGGVRKRHPSPGTLPGQSSVLMASSQPS
jgi:hypothetical protein